ncbi:MAG: mechanosensitive ion channel family protein [Caldilineaceae bacterium]
MDFFRSLMAESSLYTWGVILILGIPLLVLVLGEVLERLRRRHSRLYAPVSNFRNLLLPLLSLRLIMQFILHLDSSLLTVRVVETLLWLVVMYSVLQLLGVLIGSTRLEGAQALGAEEVQESQEIQLPRVWSELLRLITVVGVTFYVLGGVWGAPMDQVLTALGVGSIVIGFALQDTLSSLVAGMLLAFEKPFTVGHWVRYQNYQGQIIEMNWRSVRLRTLERDVVVIPNSLMGKEVAVNFTLLDPLHAELIYASFSYHHPPNQVKRMLLETCLATPGVVHQPLPHVRILGYAYDKFAVDYEIKLYTTDYARTEFIRDEVLTRIYYAAQRYNFTVPYQTTIFYQRDGAALEAPDTFPELVAQIQAIPYFARLDAAAHTQLARGAAFQYYGAEERLIEQGMSFKGFYIILEGKVQLSVRTADGLVYEVAQLGAGDFFGETLLLRDRPSPFSVVVLQDMKTLFIERTTILNVVESNARLATEMNRFIEARANLIERALGVQAASSGTATSNGTALPHRNGAAPGGPHIAA